MAGAGAIAGAVTGTVTGAAVAGDGATVDGAGTGVVAGAAAGVVPVAVTGAETAGAGVGADVTGAAGGGVGSTACCRATKLTKDGAGIVIKALLFVIRFSNDILNSQALMFSWLVLSFFSSSSVHWFSNCS